jgi:uncharacterized membrane protein YsdA (DUF1294 family)/cold shock CspA family protein
MFVSSKCKGKISQWDDAKGYGFIEPCLQGPRLFLHISDFREKPRRPVVGDLVVYQTTQGRDGKLRASSVMFSGSDTAAPKAAAGNSKLSSLLSLGFVFGLAIVVWLKQVPLQLAYFYLTLSLATFVLYWQDKVAARRGSWRTRESTLLLFGLFGGWPGAVLAQQGLRHKSVKTAFRNWFWLSVGLNVCGLLLWYDQDFIGLPIRL